MNISSVFSIIVICGLFMSSCASGKFSLERISGPLPGKIPLQETPGNEEYPDADRILLYEKNEKDIDYVPGIGQETYITVHRAWKILRKPDEFNDIYKRYSSRTEILSFAARTIEPDGKITYLDEKDIIITHEQKISDDFEFSGKQIKFTFPSVKPGSVIELKYTVVEKFSYSRGTWWIQGVDYPKLESHYTIKYPKYLEEQFEWEWNARVYNWDLDPPEKDVGFGDSGNITRSWSAYNIPAFRKEPQQGKDERYRAHMKHSISTLYSWDIAAKRGFKWFIAQKLSDSKIIREKALEIVDDAQTEAEKIERIYYFVRDFSYEMEHTYFGYGMRPNDPETVLKRGYGDCKDQSMLMIALLKSLDIPAFPALVIAGSDHFFYEDNVTLAFNHMIVFIESEENGELWLDPVMTHAPYRIWYSSSADRPALVLKEEGKNLLKRTPPKTIDKYDSRSDLTYNIKSDGSVETKMEVSLRGEMAGVFKELLEHINQTQRFFRYFIKEKYYNGSKSTDGQILSIDYGNIYSKKNTFPITLEADLAVFQADNTGEHTLDLEPFIVALPDFSDIFAPLISKNRSRTRPVVTTKNIYEYNIAVTWPEDVFSLIHIPEDIEIITKGGEHSFTVATTDKTDNSLTISIRYEIDKRTIPPENFESFTNLHRALKRLKKHGIVFKKKNSNTTLTESADTEEDREEEKEQLSDENQDHTDIPHEPPDEQDVSPDENSSKEGGAS